MEPLFLPYIGHNNVTETPATQARIAAFFAHDLGLGPPYPALTRLLHRRLLVPFPIFKHLPARD